MLIHLRNSLLINLTDEFILALPKSILYLPGIG